MTIIEADVTFNQTNKFDDNPYPSWECPVGASIRYSSSAIASAFTWAAAGDPKILRGVITRVHIQTTAPNDLIIDKNSSWYIYIGLQFELFFPRYVLATGVVTNLLPDDAPSKFQPAMQ